MNHLDYTVRQECRNKYREQACLDNPYPFLTDAYLVWSSEAHKIWAEEQGLSHE